VLGPGPAKTVRPLQDRESIVVLYDLLTHGDKSITESYVLGLNNEVPEGHWYGLVRRYVSRRLDTKIGILSNNHIADNLYCSERDVRAARS
jgi:hypothetical protein